MNEASIAAIIAFGSLAGAKLLDWLLTSPGRQTLNRKDLRDEVAAVWERNDTLEKRIDALEEELAEERRKNTDLERELAQTHWAEGERRAAEERRNRDTLGEE